MISSESHNGRVRCNRKKGFQLRGNARSVMLIGGPVNSLLCFMWAYLNQLMIVQRSPFVTGKTS
jgi:hypothetical protein